MRLRPMRLRPTGLCLAAALALPLAACGERSGAPCGIAALAGPATLLSQFAVPEQTLAEPPDRLPGRLPARLVAGPVYPAIVGRADTLISGTPDSALVIGVEGTLPEDTRPQFGVLVLDATGQAQGVMLYENEIVESAPILGTVAIGATSVPLIGIQVDPVRYEDRNCPFFPDSVLR